MIEARGAKCAYLYSLSAVRVVGANVSIRHDSIFDVADSDDEAYGRAMRAAALTFPQSGGWQNHFAYTKRIDHIESIGRHDLSAIVPAASREQGGGTEQ